MFISIGCLIIGIFGFVTRRIDVTPSKELRGGAMYAAAALFCLPLPIEGLGWIAMNVSSLRLNNWDVLFLTVAGEVLAILAALVIGFVMAEPKIRPLPPPRAQGFEVWPVNSDAK
jgi:hypothetical protein